MTTPLNPMDRDAWEKRIGDLAIEYHEFRVDDQYRSSPHSDRVWDIYAKSKSQVVTDILALQTQLTDALAEVERLNRLAKSLEGQRDEARGYSESDKVAAAKADIEKARQPK